MHTKLQPKSIRSVRTPFGTRVMRTITCARCGGTGSLSFVPKDNRAMYCQSCAAIDLAVSEESPIKTSDKLVRCMDCNEPTVASKTELFETRGKARCQPCDLKYREARRKSALSPGGVHPVVVKRTQH